MSAYVLNYNHWEMPNSPAVGGAAIRIGSMLAKLPVANVSTSAVQSQAYDRLQSLANANGKTIFDTPFMLAYNFINALPVNLRSPEIDYEDDGEVTFDWVGSRRKMMIVSLSSTGKLSFACRISDNDKQHGTKLFIDTVPQVVLDCIQKVV
jgi:hypothetical protein